MSEDKIKYMESEATAIKATPVDQRDVYETKYKKDFVRASDDYWKRKETSDYNSYSSGKIVGGFGKDKTNITDFLGRLSNMLKEGIKIELSKAGKTSEHLKEHFLLIDSSMSVMANILEKHDPDSPFNMEGLIPFLHGFINTYIETTINKKEMHSNEQGIG